MVVAFDVVNSVMMMLAMERTIPLVCYDPII